MRGNSFKCCFIYDLSDPIKDIYFGCLGCLAAYAACIYLQSVSQSGNKPVKFVTAKSRVIPIKESFTIPTLELLGNFVMFIMVFATMLKLEILYVGVIHKLH